MPDADTLPSDPAVERRDYLEAIARLPWYRRPSPWCTIPLGVWLSITLIMSLSPRPVMLIDMACVVNPPALPKNATASWQAVGSLRTDARWNAIEHPAIFSLASEPIDWQYRPAGPGFTARRPIAEPQVPVPDINHEMCRKDIGVQKLTASVAMGIQLLSGILSVLTCGFWAATSDRFGRRKVMTISLLGLIFNDICFYIIAGNANLLRRYGLSLLYIGPVVDGMLGSLVAFTVVLQAYIADVTPDGALVAYLALLSGIFMIGGMIGPVLGSVLISMTGDPLIPFKVAILSNLTLLPFLLFVLPESLSRETQDRHRRDAVKGDHTPSGTADDALMTRLVLAARRLASRIITPLEPLRIFYPAWRDPYRPSLGRDWNLFLLAIVLIAFHITAGMGEPKVQYAIFTFGWNQAEIGPYMSLMAACRFVVLICLVPILNRFVKPLFARRTAPVRYRANVPSETTPLLQGEQARSQEGQAGESSFSVSSTMTEGALAKSNIAFDYALLLMALVVEVIGCFGMGVNANGSASVFLLSSAFISLAAPGGAAVSSLALELGPEDRQPGRIFGAFGVINALSGTLLSPLIFTSIFTATIGSYPPTIFAVACAAFVLALIAALFIRLPAKHQPAVEDE